MNSSSEETCIKAASTGFSMPSPANSTPAPSTVQRTGENRVDNRPAPARDFQDPKAVSRPVFSSRISSTSDW
jgi:hypothetical protein